MQSLTPGRPSYYQDKLADMRRPSVERRSKADPAPSRLAYRYERMMLTPLFRFALRVVLPFVAAVLAVNIYFADQDRSDRFFMMLHDIRTSFVERPEFMLNAMSIDGASTSLDSDIREILPVDFPISQFDLDFAELRRQVLELSPVKTVEVRPLSGMLNIKITERTPVFIWRMQDGLQLVDAEGHVVAQAKGRFEHGDLPLIAGEGAELAATEAAALLKVAAPLGKRVRGLARVGSRRWDVVLDRNQRILLPETGAAEALERIVALEDMQNLLARDLTVVDLRIPNRPTVRIAETSMETWWKARSESSGTE